MQKFTVPQFIDVEDKIMGPITVRQFIEILVVALLLFIGYKIFDFSLFIVWAVFWILMLVVVAFLKINGMPFHYFLLNIIETVRRAPLRVWNKDIPIAHIKYLAFYKPEIEKVEKVPTKAPLEKSTLSELSLIADTGGAYRGEGTIKLNQNKKDKA